MARITKIKNIKAVVWTDALKQFLFWKKAEGVSEQTQKGLRAACEALLQEV
jgi:GH24 family phage-related lysozyme (muramidase)